MKKVYNFSSGPAILPREAMEAGSRACLEFQDMGMSLLEISHRSKEYEAVVADAIAIVKELLGVPEGYKVMFLQGGASLQFAMIPMNLLGDNEIAAYTNTGVWAD